MDIYSMNKSVVFFNKHKASGLRHFNLGLNLYLAMMIKIMYNHLVTTCYPANCSNRDWES